MPTELFQVAQKHSRKHTWCPAFFQNIVANKINPRRYKSTRVPRLEDGYIINIGCKRLWSSAEVHAVVSQVSFCKWKKKQKKKQNNNRNVNVTAVLRSGFTEKSDFENITFWSVWQIQSSNKNSLSEFWHPQHKKTSTFYLKNIQFNFQFSRSNYDHCFQHWDNRHI